LVRRPGPTQHSGSLIKLDLVADLGQSRCRGQAGQAATDHNHRIGHQRIA
jgi:hypothetical protein